MNNRIFENVDTKEKAYWLGFLYADGFIHKGGKTLRLCLSVKDEEHLDKFIKFMDGNYNDKKYYGPYKTSGKQVHYYISSQELIKDLNKYGCYYKKSKTIRFPIILQKDLYYPFLMGIYDGDGSVGQLGHGETRITSGSLKFLKDIKTIYDVKNGIFKTKSKYDVYTLSIGRLVYDKMTESYNSGLECKRNNFNGILHKTEKEAIKKKILASQKLNINSQNQCKYHITKEELEKLVMIKSWTELGKKFGVSANAVKFKAKRMGINVGDRRGYWQKKSR